MAAGVPKREICKDKARCTAVLDDVFARTDDDGWNSVCFEMAGNQTHGLMADRSKRRKDRGTRAIGTQFCQDLGRMNVHRYGLTVDGWRANEMLCQTSEYAFQRQR